MMALAGLFGADAVAQIVFCIADLPSEVGDYRRAYVNGLDVILDSGLTPGGPQCWDVSEPPYSDETIQWLDSVATSDAVHGTNFPEAAYAERATNESTGARSWSYYRIEPGVGRWYYGFYDATANPACPLKVFKEPTIDLPAEVRFGQTWSRTVEFDDCIDTGWIIIDVTVDFTAQASVDAYGTLVLPGIGEVQALRVNEVHSYEVTDRLLGLPLPTTYFRNYYWLVPGIGKALDIVSEGLDYVPPSSFTRATLFQRVFEARRVADQTSQPVTNLCIHRKGSQAVLSWESEPGATGYRVEALQDLSTTNWQSTAEPATNSWTQAIPSERTQRFFRVFIKF